MSSPCGSRGRRQVSLIKRVETSEATTSRGAEGTGPGPAPGPGSEPELPPEPGVTWSAVARISVGEGEEVATSVIGGELWMSEVKMKCWKLGEQEGKGTANEKDRGGKQGKAEKKKKKNTTKGIHNGVLQKTK